MAKKVNGAAGKLMKRGSTIQKQIKELQEELSQIKLKLTDGGQIDTEFSGSYVSSNGAVLDLTERKQFHEMNPDEVLKEMKAIKMGKHFPDVVKVQATPLKKILDENVIARLRKQKPSAISWSFK